MESSSLFVVYRECDEERRSEDALRAPFLRVIEPKKMGAHSGGAKRGQNPPAKRRNAHCVATQV